MYRPFVLVQKSWPHGVVGNNVTIVIIVIDLRAFRALETLKEPPGGSERLF